MRVLLISEIYAPYNLGGAEISTQLLAESLVKRGHEVHVYTSCDKECDEIINGVIIHRRSQHNVYWSYHRKGVSHLQKSIWHLRDMYNWQTRKDFRDLLIKINPNIVHTHVFTGFSSSVWHETVRQGIPLVHTLRDYNLLCVLSTLYKDNVECKRRCTQCRAVTLAKKYFSQKVDAVVGISQYILSKHLELGYFRRSCIQTVIPNSVKTPTKLQQTLKSRTIGFLGRVHPSKGVELLIESFLQLKKNEYDLKIAGEGDDFYIDKLRTKYPSERIHFLGKVDAYSFLSNISLLVVPSLWNEPFGRVIVEANTCGVPVLVSNRGGMPELVKDGVNGCVFKLEKEDDLKCQLSRMIDIIDMFDTQGTEMNAYKQETVADRYLDIYSHLLK